MSVFFWVLIGLGIVLLAVRAIMLVRFYGRQKIKEEERKRIRLEILEAGGEDPLPSDEEVKKLISYMAMGLVLILILILIANL